jgi:hypothetical protein
VALIRNIVTGYISLPGIGVATELVTLLINGLDYNVQTEESSRNPNYGPNPTLFCYACVFVCIVGLLLYIVVGSYAINKGLSNSMFLIVTTGCDNACFNKYTELCPRNKSGVKRTPRLKVSCCSVLRGTREERDERLRSRCSPLQDPDKGSTILDS